MAVYSVRHGFLCNNSGCMELFHSQTRRHMINFCSISFLSVNVFDIYHHVASDILCIQERSLNAICYLRKHVSLPFQMTKFIFSKTAWLHFARKCVFVHYICTYFTRYSRALENLKLPKYYRSGY